MPISNAQWDLKPCCEREEKLFIGLYVVYLVIIYALWNTQLLKPLKLLGVFIHEFGHASAAMMTCGTVSKIEVYANEGGVAGYMGGFRPLIIPAGYVGGAFWGAAFVTLSGHRYGAIVAACLLSTAFLLALCSNPNKIVVYVSVGFCILTVAAILIDFFVVTPFLQYITLFYGVFLGFYACRDIWDDTVKKTSNGSDADACATEVLKCCSSRVIGILFLIFGLGFQVMGLYFALVWLIST